MVTFFPRLFEYSLIILEFDVNLSAMRRRSVDPYMLHELYVENARSCRGPVYGTFMAFV